MPLEEKGLEDRFLKYMGVEEGETSVPYTPPKNSMVEDEGMNDRFMEASGFEAKEEPERLLIDPSAAATTPPEDVIGEADLAPVIEFLGPFPEQQQPNTLWQALVTPTEETTEGEFLSLETGRRVVRDVAKFGPQLVEFAKHVPSFFEGSVERVMHLDADSEEFTSEYFKALGSFGADAVRLATDLINAPAHFLGTKFHDIFDEDNKFVLFDDDPEFAGHLLSEREMEAAWKSNPGTAGLMTMLPLAHAGGLIKAGGRPQMVARKMTLPNGESITVPKYVTEEIKAFYEADPVAFTTALAESGALGDAEVALTAIRGKSRTMEALENDPTSRIRKHTPGAGDIRFTPVDVSKVNTGLKEAITGEVAKKPKGVVEPKTKVTLETAAEEGTKLETTKVETAKAEPVKEAKAGEEKVPKGDDITPVETKQPVALFKTSEAIVEFDTALASGDYAKALEVHEGILAEQVRDSGQFTIEQAFEVNANGARLRGEAEILRKHESGMAPYEGVEVNLGKEGDPLVTPLASDKVVEISDGIHTDGYTVAQIDGMYISLRRGVDFDPVIGKIHSKRWTAEHPKNYETLRRAERMLPDLLKAEEAQFAATKEFRPWESAEGNTFSGEFPAEIKEYIDKLAPVFKEMDDLTFITKAELDAGKHGLYGELYEQRAMLGTQDGRFNNSPMDIAGRKVYQLAIDSNLSKAEQFNVVTHEYGHAVQTMLLEKDIPARKAVREAWENAKREAANYENSDAVWVKDNTSTGAATLNFTAAKKGKFTQSYRSYVTSFEEWFAEQIALWGETDVKPTTILEKFFKTQFDELNKLHAERMKLTGEDIPLPTQPVKEFIDSVTLTNKQFEQYLKELEGRDTVTAAAVPEEEVAPTEPKKAQPIQEVYNYTKVAQEKYFDDANSLMEVYGGDRVLIDEVLTRERGVNASDLYNEIIENLQGVESPGVIATHALSRVLEDYRFGKYGERLKTLKDGTAVHKLPGGPRALKLGVKPDGLISTANGKAFKTEAAANKMANKLPESYKVVKTSDGLFIEDSFQKMKSDDVVPSKYRDDGAPDVTGRESTTHEPQISSSLMKDERTFKALGRSMEGEAGLRYAKQGPAEMLDVEVYKLNKIAREGGDTGPVMEKLNALTEAIEELPPMFDHPADFSIFEKSLAEAKGWAKRLEDGKSEIDPLRTLDRKKLETELPELGKSALDTLKEQRERIKELERPKMSAIIAELRDKIIDPTASTKDLLTGIGEFGYRAGRSLVLSRGFAGKAAVKLSEAKSRIYKGLGKDHLQLLDDYLYLTRIVEIASYSDKPLKSFGKMTPEKAKAGIAALDELYGADTMSLVAERANEYFKVMREELEVTLREGLISEAEFENMVNLRYIKRENLMKNLDPINNQLGTSRISVHESGIEALKTGTTSDLFALSSIDILEDVLMHNYARRFKNQANRDLVKVAREHPDNPFVKEALLEKVTDEGPVFKTPKGTGRDWLSVKGFEAGQLFDIRIHPEIAKGWLSSTKEITPQAAGYLRIMTATPVLKFFATGTNLGFAFVNLARDMQHIWMTSNFYNTKTGAYESMYSPHAPVGALQQVGDLAAISKDALTRTGLWKMGVDNGLAMEFMASQGKLRRSSVANIVGSRRARGIDEISNAMAWVGETMEIAGRLSLMKRSFRRIADREGISLKNAMRDRDFVREATAYSRDYLDFSQGGSFVKALDNAIPYLNASIQGTRGVFRAGMQNPEVFAYKVSQQVGMSMGLNMYNWAANPDVMKSIDKRITDNNYIIALSPELAKLFGYSERDDTEMQAYFKIPKDPGQKFFGAVGDMLGSIIRDDKSMDAGDLGRNFLSLSPTDLGSSIPPTAKAAMAYFGNIEAGFGEEMRKAWSGQPVDDPPQEFVQGIGSKGGTPELFRDVGAVTGLSPERGQAAVAALVPPNHWLPKMTMASYDYMFGNLSKYDKGIAKRWMVSDGVISRFIGVVDPKTGSFESIEQSQREQGTKSQRDITSAHKLIDKALYWDSKEDNLEGSKQFRQLLRKVGKESKNRADALKAEMVFYKQSKGIGNLQWWRALRQKSVAARAGAIHKTMKASSPEVAKGIRSATRKMFGADTMVQLRRILREDSNNQATE